MASKDYSVIILSTVTDITNSAKYSEVTKRAASETLSLSVYTESVAKHLQNAAKADTAEAAEAEALAAKDAAEKIKARRAEAAKKAEAKRTADAAKAEADAKRAEAERIREAAKKRAADIEEAAKKRAENIEAAALAEAVTKDAERRAAEAAEVSRKNAKKRAESADAAKMVTTCTAKEAAEARKDAETQVDNFYAADSTLRREVAAFLNTTLSADVRNKRRRADIAHLVAKADAAVTMLPADENAAKEAERIRAKLAADIEAVTKLYEDAKAEAASFTLSDAAKRLKKEYPKADTLSKRDAALKNYFTAYHFTASDTMLSEFREALAGRTIVTAEERLRNVQSGEALTKLRTAILPTFYAVLAEKMLKSGALKASALPADIAAAFALADAKKAAKDAKKRAKKH